MKWLSLIHRQKPLTAANQPPDLDELFKKFQQKLRKQFFGEKKGSVPPKKTSDSSSSSPMGSYLGFLFAGVVLLLWVLSGIYIVDPAEQGVILRFGKYHETVGPGPHWIPRFIDKVLVYNVERVLDYSYSGKMLTKDENLVSVSVVVQYRIRNLNDFFFNVNDPEESLKQATSSALRQVVGMNTLDQIITEGREAWGMNVEEQLTKILAIYKTGITVVNVSPQPARAPEEVQDAFDDAIKAQEDEKRFKEQAYAYAAQVVPIAEGRAKQITKAAEAYAQQIILKAKGDISAFNAILPQYQASPAVTTKRMYLDALTNVFNKSSKVIIDSKSSAFVNLPLADILGLSKATDDVKSSKTLNNSETMDDSDNADSENDLRPILRKQRGSTS